MSAQGGMSGGNILGSTRGELFGGEKSGENDPTIESIGMD